MTINQTHLAGLELAKREISEYVKSSCGDMTGWAVAEYVLAPLIAQAQAAPEAEPVAWFRTLTGADCKPDGRCYEVVFTPCDGYTPLFAAPQHDAELVELLDDLASSLECEVNARYAGSQTHPALARKYEGDMDEVRRARAKLASLRQGGE